MAFPVAVGETALYRGDSRSLAFELHEPPPVWAPATDYVAGVVGSQTYLAASTVTYAGTRYTCTTAHTSGDTFDKTKWVADPKALGALMDLSGLGTVVTCMARKAPDGAELIELDTGETDLAGGTVRIAIAPADWDTLAPYTALGFDVQVATSDGTGVTTLIAGTFAVTKDFTYTGYGT